MIRQTLTFGGIIIATLGILTLAEVDLPAAGEQLTAQLIKSVSKPNSKKPAPVVDPYAQRTQDPYEERTLEVKMFAGKEFSSEESPTRPPRVTEKAPLVPELQVAGPTRETTIPLLPTQEPKPILINDYRVSSSTSKETKEVLEKVETFICFEDYIKPGAPGNDGDEVRRWQEFLNTYMKTDLEVSGIYDLATQEAVKAFQQKHYDYIIAPWTPPLPPRTTGYIYKTTRSMANYIIGCPEPEIFLEDPGVWYSHLEQEIKFQ